MNKNLLEYLNKSSMAAKKQHKEGVFLNNIYIFIKDHIIGDVNLDIVLEKLKNSIPIHLFNGLDAIYVGQFKELQQREVNAAFMDGALYISNVQQDEESMLEDLIHEIAHSLEEQSNFNVYQDDLIYHEFLSKRLRLQKILESNGYDTSRQNFTKLEYSEKFDKYLYEEVGYPALHTMTVNLFCSPYGATSIREYFANGFEFYFAKNRKLVKTVSPQLYKKLIEVEKGDFSSEEEGSY
jgi:hypothetical protein